MKSVGCKTKCHSERAPSYDRSDFEGVKIDIHIDTDIDKDIHRYICIDRYIYGYSSNMLQQGARG